MIYLDPIVVGLVSTQSWQVVLVMGAQRQGRSVKRGPKVRAVRRGWRRGWCCKSCASFGLGDGVVLMSRLDLLLRVNFLAQFGLMLAFI